MITQSNRTYKVLRPGDPDFSFSHDGITMINRAGFAISAECPHNYKKIIQECIEYGWLSPVAHLRDTEYTWEMLQK